MSTKSTIAYSDNVHLYEDLFDSDGIFLELLGDFVDFEAAPSRVVVRVPRHIAIQLGLPIRTDKVIQIDEQPRPKPTEAK